MVKNWCKKDSILGSS